ncbi:dihydroorotase [Aquiflexum gelatinilyticum]|uniref:dihydroorotase n=1 Tax=Aquiflexum gelatinilyticum TaxID=2961943 RepID=UPI002169BEC7|nr:dihydroorotase [Aquiflexum gelatinilyticum]MCS4436137.1 dihydroorotase [Aquiflexum gelatinilyticum]
MAVLLQSLRLIDPQRIHPPKNYIFTGSEIVEDNGDSGLKIKETIDCSTFFASRGWIDLRCMSGEPGEEYRESLDSLGELLAVSGFTKAVLMPNTKPAIQTKNEVQYVQSKASGWITDLVIQAAATKDCKGEDFTDILDLHHEWVFVYGDGTHPISNPDRLLKILQYLQKFGGLLFDQTYDPYLSLFGQMHEGVASTRLGMKGIPNLSEEIAVHRNLEILKYAGGKLHLQTISTKGAVDKIREAKKEGLNVTADVSLYQLLFSDEDMASFDTNLKVMPPFRGKEDRKALIKGLKDGTIDAIVSNHQPQDFDSKFMEFDLAAFGMAGLQTFLPGMVKLAEELTWPLLISKITEGPAKVLQNELSKMDNITVFDPEENWVFDQKSNKSLSANMPWFNTELKGKVKFVINKGRFVKI